MANYNNNNNHDRNDRNTNKAEHSTENRNQMADSHAADSRNAEHENRMTREEAGRKGGNAPHKCRGRECTAKDDRKKSNDKDDSGWNIF